MGNTILGANGNQGEYEIENSAVFGDTPGLGDTVTLLIHILLLH